MDGADRRGMETVRGRATKGASRSHRARRMGSAGIPGYGFGPDHLLRGGGRHPQCLHHNHSGHRLHRRSLWFRVCAIGKLRCRADRRDFVDSRFSVHAAVHGAFAGRGRFAERRTEDPAADSRRWLYQRRAVRGDAEPGWRHDHDQPGLSGGNPTATASTPCSFRGPSSSTNGLRLNDSSVAEPNSYLRVNAPAYAGADVLISGNYADTLIVTVSASP